MSSPTPYERARSLLDSGASREDALKALMAEGVDRETAFLAVEAIAGKRPLPIEDFGDVHLGAGMAGLTPTVSLRWREDTVMDAQLNLVFGLVAAISGVAMAVLWASGHSYSYLLFGVVLLALLRVNLRDLWGSLFRMGLAGLLVTWALARGSESHLVAATLALFAGAFYAVRGLIVLQRVQQGLTQRGGGGAPNP